MSSSYFAAVSIRVVEANHLVAADRTGTSDPYVVLTLDKQRHSTKMISRTLTPQWNETFDLYLMKKQNVLKLATFDFDEYSNDDSLGDCSLNLDNLEEGKEYDEWIALQNTKKGDLHLQYTYRLLKDDEEINLVYAEDEDDPELKVRLKGESYWPLKGSVFPPSNWVSPPELAKSPNAQLELEFVHGFRGHDCRENLHYNSAGNLVYHAAAVGIVYDTVNCTQKFFFGHTDDIVSLAIHPNKDIVATGQVASLKNRHPRICVWNSVTLETLAVIEGFHERSVCSLGFSPDGHHLVSVGMDDKNSVCVYDWNKKKEVANAYGHSQKIFVSKYLPHDNTSFVTCGVKHIKFWKLENNKIVSKDGLFKRNPIQSFVSIAFTAKEVIAGAYSGDIYFWNPTTGEATFVIPNAHDGPAYAVLYNSRLGLVTAGKDGKVLFWGENPQSDSKASKSLSLSGSESQTEEESVGARAIAFKQGQLAIGTKNSEIHLISTDNLDSSSAVTLALSGHSEEIWGLATHPSKSLYATSAKDKYIKLWDSQTKKLVQQIKTEEDVSALGFSHDGEILAAGLQNGTILLLSSENLSKVDELKGKESKVNDLKFSPSGEMLAIGYQDATIDIWFEENSSWKKIGSCKGHSSSVTHLDWDVNSKVLQSDSGSYEHLFWEIEDISQITRTTSVRNVLWNTWTCILGWHVKGIWPKGADGTDINAVSRSHNSKLVATSDDFGEVKLFRFPCIDQTQKSFAYGGHSSHVTNVRFDFNDSHVISAGGNDRTVFQWKVIPGSDKDEPHHAVHDDKKDTNGKAATGKKVPGATTTPTKTVKVGDTKNPTKTKVDPKDPKSPKTVPATKTTGLTPSTKTPTATTTTATTTPTKKKDATATTTSEKERVDRLEKRIEELEQLVKSLASK